MNQFRPIATPTRTVEIMRQYDIKMKKSLGQNFLVEPQILEKMIATSSIDKDTTVIEIGPGIGALTEYLARHAKEVFAFEIDARFIDILKETLSGYDNVTIFHQDILTVNFNDAQYKAIQEAKHLIVVANLPYYITTPIIMHLLASGLDFDSLSMMMQKEVAERMTAPVNTKAYSSLTIAIQNYMQANVAFIVPKGVFIPQPKVDSAVLHLSRRQTPLVSVDSQADFEQFVRVAFTQRRKTIWNNYRNASKDLHLTIPQVEAMFEVSGLEKTRRAESLTIYDFERLYQAFLEIK